MKKILLSILFLICLVTLVFFSTARAASVYDHPTVAVLPYVNKAAVSKGLSIKDASIVSDIVLGCVGKIEQTKKHKQFSDKISLKVEECLCQTYFIT